MLQPYTSPAPVTALQGYSIASAAADKFALKVVLDSSGSYCKKKPSNDFMVTSQSNCLQSPEKIFNKNAIILH